MITPLPDPKTVESQVWLERIAAHMLQQDDRMTKTEIEKLHDDFRAGWLAAVDAIHAKQAIEQLQQEEAA